MLPNGVQAMASLGSPRAAPQPAPPHTLQRLVAEIFIYLSEKGASLHSDAERTVTPNTVLCTQALPGPPSSTNQAQKALQEIRPESKQQNHLVLGLTGRTVLSHPGREGLWGAMLPLTAGPAQTEECIFALCLGSMCSHNERAPQRVFC